MNIKLTIARNIGSNWLGLGVNILVGFFLSPYILHRLGDTAFGLWILIFSFTGYYGLFDMGIRSSVIRHVAKYSATGDTKKVNQLICTALFGYGCLSVVLLMVTFTAAANAHFLFRVSQQSLLVAKQLIWIVGTCVSLAFPMSVFAGALQGLQEFHWVNANEITSTLTRAILIILALRSGYGLLTVVTITAAFPLLGGFLHYLVVRRKLRFRVSWNVVDRKVYRELIGFGSITFVIMVADRLRFQTDAIVVGAILGPAMITRFAIGSKLVDYAMNMVDSMAEPFMPLSSGLDANRDTNRLQDLLIAGNRACAFVIFPVCVTLIILGKSVIAVWVGAQYIFPSYIVLVLLVIPRSIYRAQGASTRILFGMARHQMLAVALLSEGVVNLLLSVFLTRKYGVIGNAAGTAIPLLATALLFLPYHLSRRLSVPLGAFLKQAFAVPALLCVPLAGTLLIVQRILPVRGWWQLPLQLFAGVLVYGTGLTWLILKYDPVGISLRQRFAGNLLRIVGREART
jgi:O-antigen/teichoic acid export membrane protein